MSEDLTQRPIPALIRQIAVPTSVGFFFHTMYNVVDTYYAGYISTEALAALSLSFPVFFVVIAAAVGTGSGTTALISTALGGSERHTAKIYVSQALVYSVLVSVIISYLGLKFAPAAFGVLGATGQCLEDSLAYVNVLFWGSFTFVFVSVLSAFLTSIGNTKPYRNFLIGAFFLNLVLNPWFLFGGFGLPAMGLRGIALATVVAELLGCFYLLNKVVKAQLISTECFSYLTPRPREIFELARLGMPASLDMMTVALGVFVITYFVSAFGETAVAAYGIATRVEQIALLPAIGLNVSTLALVGHNSGARLYERVREVWSTTLLYGFYISLPGSLFVYSLRKPLLRLFSSDIQVIEIGSYYLSIAAFSLWAYIILFVCVNALQGLKKPMYGFIIGLLRQIIAPALVIPFLAQYLNWQVGGVWWGIFFVVWSAAAFSFFYTRNVLGQLGS
ncbi:hypothetical protein BVY02_00115 [bacterium J17]|nr:hypothetical protein BVY02_00115 [bacterium J17]